MRDEGQLCWQYTHEWQLNGFPVSPHLPLSNDISSVNVSRFLRNTFPEGQAFDELLQYMQISRNNTFALVNALGLDLLGALTILPENKALPSQLIFRALTENELLARLNSRSVNSLIIWDGKPRLSVAGLQDKINVVKNKEGQLGFGEEALYSTHILKFERQSQAYLVLNEYITMGLAKACGLNVANVSLQQYGSHNALLVERFDRKWMNGQVKKRQVIDGCQALNLDPDHKYERWLGSGRDVAHIRDGANLPQLFKFADHCQQPALVKHQILDWVLFNLLVFNVDAHAKNISFLCK